MDIVYTKTEKAVGLFVVGIVLLLLAALIMIGRGKDWFRSYVVYTTSFEEGYGIEADTAVKLYKTDIGKVKTVTLVGDRVELKLAIQEEYAPRITAGTRVTIESPTLFGSEYVSIKPGSISSPAIAPGKVIPSKPSQSLGDLLADMEVEKTAKRIVNLIANLEAITRQLADPQGPLSASLSHVEETTGNLAEISKDLHDGKGTAGQMIRSEALLESIEARLVKLDAVIDPMAEAARQAPPAMTLVQENLVNLKRIQSKAEPAVEQLRVLLERTGGTMDSLQKIVERVEQASIHALPAAQSTRETMDQVTENIEEIEQIIEAVRQNFLIRPHLPAAPAPEAIDSGIRP